MFPLKCSWIHLTIAGYLGELLKRKMSHNLSLMTVQELWLGRWQHGWGSVRRAHLWPLDKGDRVSGQEGAVWGVETAGPAAHQIEQDCFPLTHEVRTDTLQLHMICAPGGLSAAPEGG